MEIKEKYLAKFIGKKEYCGLKRNKEYLIMVTENKPYGIKLNIYSEKMNINTVCPYCNVESAQKYWKIIEKEI